MTYFSLSPDDHKKFAKHVEGLRKQTILKLVLYHDESGDIKLDKVAPTEKTVLARFLKL